ncbi:MAG: hypothetical protein N2B02_04080, partial [Amylibacter sp.]
MAVVHTFVNIGLAVVMLPILKQYNKTVTYGYFGTAIAASRTVFVDSVVTARDIEFNNANSYVVAGLGSV